MCIQIETFLNQNKNKGPPVAKRPSSSSYTHAQATTLRHARPSLGNITSSHGWPPRTVTSASHNSTVHGHLSTTTTTAASLITFCTTHCFYLGGPTLCTATQATTGNTPAALRRPPNTVQRRQSNSPLTETAAVEFWLWWFFFMVNEKIKERRKIENL
jgi:hypothetical protein